jgi:UDP-2,4-diacetamido-2,4,6-trideoxy-beta-L-altropyranose hydrolase
MIVLTEGGADVGLGHVRRCLTLAAALRNEEIECTFHVRGGSAVIDLIAHENFPVTAVEDFHDQLEDAPAVLIDSYRVEDDLFALGIPTIVIDDLADRRLPVDVVINPAAGSESLTYIVRDDTHLLLGVRYALLRPQFTHPFEREIREGLETIMITLGGNDHGSLALDLVRWTRDSLPQATVEVIAGPFFQHLDEIRAFAVASGGHVRLRTDVRDISVMLGCDLAISSGGQTLYELAVTGTPAIALSTAENQRHNIAALSAAGTIVALEEKTPAALARALAGASDGNIRREMSRRGRALVDGRGSERAAAEIARLVRRHQ